MGKKKGKKKDSPALCLSQLPSHPSAKAAEKGKTTTTSANTDSEKSSLSHSAVSCV